MTTWHIHIEGQVQGVGFRPFVYSMAQKYELQGWVNNTIDGVHIVFNADENLAGKFAEELVAKAPPLSKITAIHKRKKKQQFFDHFQIIHSSEEGEPNLLITPDFGLCEDCREELHQAANRRHGYPFITCTNCGPRFSIINSVPYDREYTEMSVFQMCATCSEEYNNPLDRRYYSQTNSCSDCGIELTLFDADQNPISKDSEEIVNRIIQHWQEGKIIAIKGIGGYLLTCDANNSAAVLELRKRKHRPSKPFALMFPNKTSVEGLFDQKEAIQEMNTHVSPIVLMEWSEDTETFGEIAPGLNQVGVMLPYTPLYERLLHKFDKPIVATSGNISNSPIVFQDEKALSQLSKIADFILLNNRDIVIPQDDSVVKFSFFKKQKIVLRRSRGLAPTYINPNLELPGESILAMGGMLKSTFSFLHKENIHISQYLGDLEQFDTQQNYQLTIQHFLNLFQAQPDCIIKDKHPEYPSTHYGEQLANELSIPTYDIQHHIAHFGAILGEHHLMHADDTILGVIWDGTGFGNDGQIWGGEFFKYHDYQFSRCAYFDYFDFILGDKMPREPRISALSACWDVVGAEEFLKDKFSKTEWQIYHKLLQKDAPLQTSSLGRIFDAVASLLGILDKQTFEGEAAMRLEALATSYFKKNGLDFSSSYFQEDLLEDRIPTKALMDNIIKDLWSGQAKDFIAAKFHFSLVKLIKTIADNFEIKKLAFSGGVFQNGLLLDLILHHLKEDFELFFHQQLAANDENISFGQLICYQIVKHRVSFNKNKLNNHVFSNSWQNQIH